MHQHPPPTPREHRARRAPESLLDSYGEERGPQVEEVTATVKRLGQIICERDPVRASERDQRLREQQGGQVRMQIRQSLLPGVRHGLIDRDGLPAGTPFPQPMSRIQPDTAPQMMDDLLPRGFLLVLRRAPDPVAAFRAVEDAAAALTEADGVLAAWFERHGCEAALVRPDHLVYGVARSLEEAGTLMQRACKALGASAPVAVA